MFHILNNSFPCSTCKAECCGPVPVRVGEYKRILNLLRELPVQKLDELKAQKRHELDCPFVDMSNYTCAIYQARPTVCKIYGLTPKLACPYNEEASHEIPPDEARAREVIAKALYGEVLGITAFDITWERIAKDL